MRKIDTVNVFGETFDIYDNIDNKQLMASSRIRPLKVKFGDPNMPEFPGTNRGNNYCSRSLGIANKFNIKNDVTSPNFWSRWYLWNCKGNKSYNKRPRL